MNINSIASKLKEILPEAKTAIVLGMASLVISIMSNVVVNSKINTELYNVKTIEQVQQVQQDNDTIVMNALDSAGKPLGYIINTMLKATDSSGHAATMDNLIEDKKIELSQESSNPFELN